jgi:hypothetical protein
MSLPQFVQASPRKSRKSQVEPYERNHGELAGKHNPSNASAARRKQQVGGESWRRGSAIPPAGDAEARIKDEVDDFLRKTAGRHTNKVRPARFGSHPSHKLPHPFISTYTHVSGDRLCWYNVQAHGYACRPANIGRFVMRLLIPIYG